MREVAVLVELAAALELAPAALAAEVRPETLGAETEEAGVPVEVPETEMLPALRTWVAAMVRLPEERMPASPASTKPAGAMRSTSPGGTPWTAVRTPMPPPVARPARSVWTAPLWGSMRTRVGGALRTVRAELPAAMLPSEDQMIWLPPRRVKMRPMPTLTSSRVKMWMGPPLSVTMPGGARGLPMVVSAMASPPPGLRMEMVPPLRVRMSRPRVRMVPEPGLGKRAAMAAKPEG